MKEVLIKTNIVILSSLSTINDINKSYLILLFHGFFCFFLLFLTFSFKILFRSSKYQFSRRDPKSLVKPIDSNNSALQNEYKQKIEEKKSRATRHIFLVRHGQYNLKGETDGQRKLTELGMY